MRILLDLDGVVYQFDKTAQYMIARHLGMEYREQLAWDHKQYWRGVPREEWDWLFSESQVDPLFRHGHLYRGAIEGVYDLAERGHSIHVVTKRPEYARRVTIEFLQYHYGRSPWPFDEITILGNKHGSPEDHSKAEIEGDVLIDDGYENVTEWADTGRVGVIMDQPWNEKHGAINGVIRAFEWTGVVSAIDALTIGIGDK